MFQDIVLISIGLVIGLILGFFLSKYFMQKYLKKNPPINEEMIKVMMSGMGKTPNKKQINQIMKQMTRVSNK